VNETVQSYCKEAGVEFTRCPRYRKNDQAWVEQKNGAVVRRIVGYRRFVGLQAAAALGRLSLAADLRACPGTSDSGSIGQGAGFSAEAASDNVAG
jgi:hypothetical protein